MNKSKSVVSGILKFSISTVANFIIGFLSVIITTRIISPDIYGLNSIFYSSTNLLMYIFCFGLDSAYIRYYNEPPRGDQRINMTFKLLTLVFISIMSASVVGCLFFYEKITSTIFGFSSLIVCVMLSINVLSNTILRFFNITYRMQYNVKQYTIQNIMISIATRLLVIVGYFIMPTFVVVIATQTLGIFSILIFYFLKMRKDLVPAKISISYKGYGELFKYALFSGPNYVVSNLNTYLSQQVILSVLGSKQLGIYSSAGIFQTLIHTVSAGFGTYWAAFMYENYKKEQRIIWQMHNVIVFVGVIMAAGMVLGKNILYYILGEGYQDSKIFFSLVILYPILSFVAQTTNYGTSIAKKANILLINNVIVVAVNVASCFLLTPKYGIAGAAMSSAISGIVYLSINTACGQYFYRSIPSWSKTVTGVGIIVAICVLNYAVKDWSQYVMIAGLLLLALILYYKDIYTFLFSREE